MSTDLNELNIKDYPLEAPIYNVKEDFKGRIQSNNKIE